VADPPVLAYFNARKSTNQNSHACHESSRHSLERYTFDRVLKFGLTTTLEPTYNTDTDDYIYTPDNEVTEGKIQESRRFIKADFHRIIEIEVRERLYVELFMN